MKTPALYERKFADFIRLCSEAKAAGQTQILVAYPWVLGDTYEELIEKLVTPGRRRLDFAHSCTRGLAQPKLDARRDLCSPVAQSPHLTR